MEELGEIAILCYGAMFRGTAHEDVVELFGQIRDRGAEILNAQVIASFLKHFERKPRGVAFGVLPAPIACIVGPLLAEYLENISYSIPTRCKYGLVSYRQNS